MWKMDASESDSDIRVDLVPQMDIAAFVARNKVIKLIYLPECLVEIKESLEAVPFEAQTCPCPLTTASI